ncbi:MAG: T9SS type A sorting domain-containing protein [Bacteroidota bacterium]
MKALFIVLFSIVIYTSSFGQVDFAPVGATWVGYVSCSGSNFPPPPPYHYSFTVAEEDTIQGKYCTRLDFGAWICNGGEDTWVHQDGDQIYVYDVQSSSFKLVYDFSKEVGESWQIEVCEDIFGTNTINVTVLERDGSYRKILTEGVNFGSKEFSIYEGFGGLENNERLLFPIYYFVHADPSCYDNLVCYEDPSLGLLYGSGSECLVSTDEVDADFSLDIHPNPSHAQATLSHEIPFNTNGEIFIFDGLGQQLTSFKLTGEKGTVDLPVFSSGIYFIALMIDGRPVLTKRWVSF